MSMRLLRLAWPLRTTPPAKAVLIALADLERDDGRPNFPSIATLCSMTCYSNRAVIDAIRTLEAAGFIDAQRGGNGRKTVYRVTLEPVSEAHRSDDDESPNASDTLSTTSEPASPLPVSEAHRSESGSSERGALEPVNVATKPVNVAPKPVSQAHTTPTPNTPKEPERGEAQTADPQADTATLSKTDSENPQLPDGFIREALRLRPDLKVDRIRRSYKRFAREKPAKRTDLGAWLNWIETERAEAPDRATAREDGSVDVNAPTANQNASGAPEIEAKAPDLAAAEIELFQKQQEIAASDGVTPREAGLALAKAALKRPVIEHEAAA